MGPPRKIPWLYAWCQPWKRWLCSEAGMRRNTVIFTQEKKAWSSTFACTPKISSGGLILLCGLAITALLLGEPPKLASHNSDNQVQSSPVPMAVLFKNQKYSLGGRGFREPKVGFAENKSALEKKLQLLFSEHWEM